MSKYLVTGLGGSGKSTVCESLRSRGVNVFDSNNVPGLASWRNAYTDKPIKVDPSGYVDWSKVAWDWDESVLKKLLVDNENLILCGSASNQMRFHRLFDRIFVLALDRKTHRRHLEGRSSPYGKDFKTMAELLDEQQEFAKNLISHGAIAIDASGTPEQTAEQILEHISMKAEEWLKRATNNLRAKNIGSARLDSLILLEDELGWDRAWVLAHPEAEIKPEQVKKLNKKITRRASYEPLAYIRGFSEFYGRKFKVNKRVLEPRPESETMIELLKEVASSKHQVASKKLRIADVGAGSGALGITAVLELHNPEVDLYDIDASCLAVARHNSHMHELHLHCYKRDLINRPVRPYDVLLANLPYVPDRWKINKAAAMEPRIAIFGGKDGLDVYRRLFDQINKLPWQPKYIFTESLPPQHQKLAKIAKNAGYKLLKSQDFIQLFSKLDVGR